MVNVCFYFQVHQPFRLRRYTVFDIGKPGYFDHEKNKAVCQKVAQKCYLPANKVMLDCIKKNPEFRIAYSISGVAMEQFFEYSPEVVASFQELADTGNVEFLSETYYHSLSFLYSRQEFFEQVMLHKKLMKDVFGQSPKVFRNTELIYNNELAKYIEELGYKGIIAEGSEKLLGWRSPNFVYRPTKLSKLKLLLKNYKMSDDIAFRFSHPLPDGSNLTAEKFASWLSAHNGNGVTVNLFMDYETIGEHQWEHTGIFKFFSELPRQVLQRRDSFMTPSEVVSHFEPVGEVDCHDFASWADIERDLTAWLGNNMQKAALHEIYALEPKVRNSKNKELASLWRKLTTSDHFYYMCTKWFNDGDVHKYFNPFDTPYDGFINFMNVINDMQLRLEPLPMEVENVQ